MQTATKLPLFHFTHEDELTLYLIMEELKSRKFFNTLRTVGLDDAFYQADLSGPILNAFGLTDESNETMDGYYRIMEKYAEGVTNENGMMVKQAMKAYGELSGLTVSN